MMAENYALLNIENDSHLLIENSAINGMTRFITTVTGSTLRVLNCANQGLVRCPLTLDDSTAEISGNDYGISGYNKTDVLTMKNGSSLTMEDNNSAGIFLYGGNIDVQDARHSLSPARAKIWIIPMIVPSALSPYIITTIPMPQTSPLLTVHR
mgnify:CR=1 FL=1